MISTTVYVLLVILVATIIRSTIGFGEGLIAVPLLALRLPINIAAPLAVLVSITVAALVLLQDREHVEFRSAGWLFAATVVGIPFGLWLLTHGNVHVVKAILGSLIVAFAVNALARRQPPELRTDRWPWILGCGFFAGVLGGAYGMNGPPLAIYGAMRRWSAQRFRATLQGYFLPASIVGMTGYWLAGLWVASVTRYFLLSLPITVGAVLLGRSLSRRLHDAIYLRYVYLALVAIGLALLIQAIVS